MEGAAARSPLYFRNALVRANYNDLAGGSERIRMGQLNRSGGRALPDFSGKGNIILFFLPFQIV